MAGRLTAPAPGSRWRSVDRRDGHTATVAVVERLSAGGLGVFFWLHPRGVSRSHHSKRYRLDVGVFLARFRPLRAGDEPPGGGKEV